WKNQCPRNRLARSSRAGRRGSRRRAQPSSLILLLAEQPELSRIARGLGEAEMAERMPGEQAAARRALDEPLLNEERLHDLLARIPPLRHPTRTHPHPPPPPPPLLPPHPPHTPL